MNNNTINLGRKRGDLNLILLQPKQKSRAKEQEATVTKVLMNRLGIADTNALTEYEKLFKGKNIKNMKKLRIKVVFFCESFQFDSISPQHIIDTGNKDIGAMDFIDCLPRKCCDKGLRKIHMVSEYNLSKDVAPIFQVFRPDGKNWVHAPEYEKFLIQPADHVSKYIVRNTKIVFEAPPQPNLAEIPRACQIKIAVKRFGDGHITDKKFKFFYIDCVEGQCMYCDFGCRG